MVLKTSRKINKLKKTAEEKVNALTPEMIHNAMKKHLDLSKFNFVKAGDFEKAEKEAQKMWEVVAVDREGLRIEAVATTSLLRFKDDIVIEVRASIEGAEVHMRSKSRVGRSDFGANAKRIESFFSKLKK